MICISVAKVFLAPQKGHGLSWSFLGLEMAGIRPSDMKQCQNLRINKYGVMIRIMGSTNKIPTKTGCEVID
jgi:hypothetical protein